MTNPKPLANCLLMAFLLLVNIIYAGDTGVNKSVGWGKDKGSETSTTHSGIGTGNITITDAQKQQELTGKTVEQTIADIKTDINTDKALEYQGLDNIFDKDKVQKEIDLQVEVTQQFDKNRQEMKQVINQKIDAAKEQGNKADQEKWELVGKILDSVAAGLYAPTESIGGSLVAAASPELATQIGNYFAGLRDDKGNLSLKDNIAHKLAHGILGAVVAAATGGDATNGFLAGAGGELLGEMVKDWLYPNTNVEDLTAEQKATISAIVGLGSAGLGAAIGDGTTDIATGNLISTNAVENNFLGPKDQKRLLELRDKRDKEGSLGLTDKEREELALLDTLNQKTDYLLNLYRNNSEELTEAQQQFLENSMGRVYVQMAEEYGAETALNLIVSVMAGSGFSNNNYDFPYAGYDEQKENALNALKETMSFKEWLLWSGRDISDNEKDYNDYLRYKDRQESFDTKLTEMVGRPSLNFVGGIIGGIVNGVEIAQGSYDFGAGMHQWVRDGELTVESGYAILNGLITGGAGALGAYATIVKGKGGASISTSTDQVTTGKIGKNSDGLYEVTFDRSPLDGFDRLNTIDVLGNGKLNPAEAAAAARVETVLGKMDRLSDSIVGGKNADFEIVSGPNKGKTVDLMYTTSNLSKREIEGINKFFEKNMTVSNSPDKLPLGKQQILDHLNKADYVPVDFSVLTPKNQKIFMDYVRTLPKSQQDRILIMR